MSKTIYLFSISAHPQARQINPLSINFFKPEVDFTKYDNFIITSKQIAKILSFYETKRELLKPALCISKQSAKSYEAIGGTILALGKGYGDTLVEKIQEYKKSTKWLYLRAETIASDFAQICRNDGYDIDEVVLYESKCSKNLKDIRVQKSDILIFTSPSSVMCFLEHNNFLEGQKIVVIGKTTLKKIPKEMHAVLSKEKTIESCIQIAHTL